MQDNEREIATIWRVFGWDGHPQHRRIHCLGFDYGVLHPNRLDPERDFAKLVGPMIIYLLPLLIGYTGGKLVHGACAAVLSGAVATMGVIVGADIPMMLGAMIMGPLGGWDQEDRQCPGRQDPGRF
jgi:mannitol-specific phosphotransferase system IIBC component